MNGFEHCIDDEIDFEVQNSWLYVRLGELCDIINGFTPLRTNELFWHNGTIPWFTIEDIHNQGRRIKKTKQFISSMALSEKSNRVLPKNTVLLCCTASVGEYAITEIKLTTNQQFNGLIIKETYKNYYNPEFLFAIAPNFKKVLIKKAGKTTFNFISVKKLSNIIVPLPPIEQQNEMVDLLNRVNTIL